MAAAPRAGGRALPAAFLVLGLWGLLAPYVGPSLGFVILTRPVVEFVDHAVPGAVVLLVAGYGLVTARVPLPAALTLVLAGLWMTGTHIPLLIQASRDLAPMPASIFHSTPGIAIFVLAIATAVVAWGEAAPNT